jgi:hypothetical protein
MASVVIGALAAIVAMVGTSVSSFAAQVARIGLVDLSIERTNFSDLDDVTVRTMTFWTSGTAEARKQDSSRKRSHGEDMVRSLVQGFRAVDPETTIVVYVATPFRADPKTGSLKLDMDDLNVAYRWFQSQGVRVVGETFVGPDSADQREALQLATTLGLVVLASAGNGPSHNVVPPYPAAYDEAISISTTALSSELSREANRDTYVDFSVAPRAISAIAYRQDPELSSLQGSSAATATATGLLGALSIRGRMNDRGDAVMLLSCVARPTDKFAGGRAWGNGVLVPNEIGARLRAKGPHAQPCGDAA